MYKKLLQLRSSLGVPENATVDRKKDISFQTEKSAVNFEELLNF